MLKKPIVQMRFTLLIILWPVCNNPTCNFLANENAIQGLLLRIQKVMSWNSDLRERWIKSFKRLQFNSVTHTIHCH